MGTLGAVLGVFLVFSIVVSWAGGDREKALLEDDLKESRRVQAEMAAEAEQAKNEALRRDERINGLQGGSEDPPIVKKRPVRAAAEESRKRASGEDKPRGGLWDALSAGAEEEGGTDDPMLDAAEASPGREAPARAEAERKLAAGRLALSYIETTLDGTLMEAGRGLPGVYSTGAAFCPWDPGKR